MATKAGFVALVGAPNAGKSTLLNALLRKNLASVSPKAQTTRIAVRGILTTEEAQYIFVDTPGLHQPRRKLEKAMMTAASQAYQQADVILMLVDAHKGFGSVEVQQAGILQQTGKPCLLAFTKIDTLPNPNALLPLMAQAAELDTFQDILALNSLKRDGLDELLETLQSHLPASPFLYPPEYLTDLPLHLLAAEKTRERAFLYLQDELPYAMAIEPVSWEEAEDGSVTIHQNLLVERETHKGIALGHNGQMLKKIGQTARAEMEKLFERTVHLYIQVKVNPKWAENAYVLRDIGLG